MTHPAGCRVPEAEGPESAEFLTPAVDLPDYLAPLEHLAGIFRGDGEEDERRGGAVLVGPVNAKQKSHGTFSLVLIGPCFDSAGLNLSICGNRGGRRPAAPDRGGLGCRPLGCAGRFDVGLGFLVVRAIAVVGWPAA